MRAWLVVAAFCVVFLAGYGLGESHATLKAELAASAVKGAAQEATAKQEQDARTEEDRRHDVVEDVSRGTADRAEALADLSAVADSAAGRLLNELDRAEKRFASSQATCNARIAQQRTSAQAQYSLLAELYREADRAQGELVAEAERYRLAGQSCESVYDGVRNSTR